MTQDTNLSAENPWAVGIDCLLTLALPLALEEEVLDLLRQQKDLVPGFSVTQGHGIGGHAPLTTAMEQVQGRARRVFVHMVMRSDDVAPLVARLREVLPSPQVFYWAVPLQAFGRLA